jgi:trigger factor
VDIQFNKNEDLSANLTLTFTPEDYQPKWDELLKKQQKNVAVKGFRPGKAPMGMVKKMYGGAILLETINNMINESVDNYLKENNIEILARPIEIDTDKEYDFENPSDFEFKFEIGLAPEFDLNVSEKDELIRYNISIEDSEIDKEVEMLCQRNGELKEVEVASNEDVIYASVAELDAEGSLLDGGVTGKKVTFTLKSVDDETTKNAFVGKTKGDVVNADIFKVYKDDKSVVARTLEVSEDEAEDLNSTFQFSIEEVKAFTPAIVGQELFDKVFPGLNVNDETTFREKIKEGLAAYYKDEAEYYLDHQIEKLLNQNHSFSLPANFLKKWMLASDKKNYNEENIEEKYDAEAQALSAFLIREKIVEKYEVEVTEDEIKDTAIAYSIGMFRQYGIPNAGPEMVGGYAAEQLKESSFRNKMFDIAQKKKVYDKVRDVATIKDLDIEKEAYYAKINEERSQQEVVSA